MVGAIGIGCFGPVDLNPDSKSYGYITSTPKPGWRNTDVAGILRRELNVNITMDTDVNAAAMGEFDWGASKGIDPSLYLTIGTGIGGGYINKGKPLMGLLTPEMGHIHVPTILTSIRFPVPVPSIKIASRVLQADLPY